MDAITALTVSDDMEIVIPRAVSAALHLKPGQRLRAMAFGGSIQLVTMLTLDEAQGFP